MRKHLEHRASGVGVRLGVRTTGCSGLSYVLEFVDSMETSDQIFEFDDIKLVIDPKSLLYLDGTELDYVKEGLNEGFEFKNPKKTKRLVGMPERTKPVMAALAPGIAEI